MVSTMTCAPRGRLFDCYSEGIEVGRARCKAWVLRDPEPFDPDDEWSCKLCARAIRGSYRATTGNRGRRDGRSEAAGEGRQS
jgi:hypothetical protein